MDEPVRKKRRKRASLKRIVETERGKYVLRVTDEGVTAEAVRSRGRPRADAPPVDRLPREEAERLALQFDPKALEALTVGGPDRQEWRRHRYAMGARMLVAVREENRARKQRKAAMRISRERKAALRAAFGRQPRGDNRTRRPHRNVDKVVAAFRDGEVLTLADIVERSGLHKDKIAPNLYNRHTDYFEKLENANATCDLSNRPSKDNPFFLWTLTDEGRKLRDENAELLSLMD